MQGILLRTGSAAFAGLIAGYAAALAGLVFETEAAAIPYGKYALAAGVFLVLSLLLYRLFLFIGRARVGAVRAHSQEQRDAPQAPAADIAPVSEPTPCIGEPERAEPEIAASPDDREAWRVAQVYGVIQATQEGRALDAILQEILAKADRVRAFRSAKGRAGERETDDDRRRIDAMLREIIADFRTFERKDPLCEFMHDMGGFHVVGLLAEFGMSNIAYGLYRNMKDDYVKAKIREQHPDIFAR